ncbi:ligand-binding sensor domain-containing protein [Flavihumibacter petaseus]|uniref:Putative two-component histidine kinase n=1 Tax=Flavihumibacter petaseus NBRC 106054 TaxID=1220578 RepID=A0A0E9MU44_9BACT|nr:sensor histidine kinase [Flavihumibacter petaseus]GAO41089.1 putative two-component histidine kinase [Flavihumibacter petaseus NBRC 106054]
MLCFEDAHAQFSGFHVQHFNSENGLPNSIKGMLYDSNGYLWLATESGLVRFDGTHFRYIDKTESGSPVTRLVTVDTTAAGDIFVQAEAGRYFRVTANHFLQPADKSILRKGIENTSVTPDLANAVFSRCRKKFGDGQLQEWALPNIMNSSRSYLNSFTIAGGHYIFLNHKSQVIVADTGLQRFQVVRLAFSGHREKSSTAISPGSLSLLPCGNKVLLRYGDSIFQMQFRPDYSAAALRAILPAGEIPNIIGLLELPEQNIYIAGTLTDGIYVLRRQEFSTVRNSDRDANVFYATVPLGSDGVFTPRGLLTPERFVPLGMDCSLFSMLKTSRGTYYLNRRDYLKGGILEFDSSLQLVQEIYFPRNGISCFRECRDGSIWLSAIGYFMGRLVKDSVLWQTRPAGLPADFPVAAFVEAGPNVFWIAGSMGIAKVDFNKYTAHWVPELNNKAIRNLYLDEKGTLWIATYGNGFYAWYDNRLTSFPVDQDQYLNFVHTFLPDHSGRFWLTTNHGLFVVATADLYRYLSDPKKTPYYYYFDHTAGMSTSEFNGGGIPAGIVLGNGKFSLPTMNGLVQFFADSIRPVFPDAAFFLDKVMADTTELSTVFPLTVPCGKERLQFYFSSPYFGNTRNQQIIYRIDKEDNPWHVLKSDQVIELNNLKKGEHTIWLRKPSGFGKDGEILRRFDFTVEPMFTETVVFRLMLLLLAALLAYGLYRLRIRLLLMRQQRLEKEVLEKTREQQALIGNLELVVSELEASQDELHKLIQFKEYLAMIVTHDLQSPLRFLADAIDRLQEPAGSYNSNAEAADLGREIRKTTRNIHQFVNDFHVWIKNINLHGQIDPAPVHLSTLLEELQDFFRELQKSRGNVISTNVPPGTWVDTNYQLLKIILRNIIDNANKHTRGGLVMIRTEASDGLVSIAISDDGTGMKPAVREKILKHARDENLFSYGKESDALGFGYRFVTDFCKLMKIELDIENNIQGGTKVVLRGLKHCPVPQATAEIKQQLWPQVS